MNQNTTKPVKFKPATKEDKRVVETFLRTAEAAHAVAADKLKRIPDDMQNAWTRGQLKSHLQTWGTVRWLLTMNRQRRTT